MHSTIAPTHRDLRAPARIARLVFTTLLFLTMAAAPVSADPGDHPRVRFGISGVGGGFVGAAHGFVGGLSPRIGLQLNDVFAVYVQGHGLVGQFFPAPGDNITGFAFHTIMFELTLADHVQFGAGPSLDFVWGCDPVYQISCAGSGPYFGGDARVAILVGSPGPGRRSGLAFSFDVHPTWFGDAAAVALLLGIGYEIY